MKLEHVALNVAEPEKLIAWWVANLGFTQTAPAFIVDDSGQMAFEIYKSDATLPPNYSAKHPMAFHVALLSDDVEADRARLEKAGAKTVEIVHKPGFDMVMMRDPFGIALQFVKRAEGVLR